MENMNEQEMKDMILQYIINQYIDDEDAKVGYNTPLISSGFIDSFSMVSMLVFLEHRFKIKIPTNKATPEAFDSVNNIVSLVKQYL